MSCTKEIPKRESKGDSEKMKKFLSMALCAVMVLGILAGCGQKGNDTPENNDNNTALSGTVSTNGSTSMDKVIGALKEQFGMDIDGKKLVLEQPIKSFGGYQVKAKLGFEITGTVYVLVCEEK